MREWVSEAKCASDGVNAQDFQVPLRGDSQNRAKLICRSCPVQIKCLTWALEHDEIWGVWGGLDEAEIRHALSVDAVGRYVRRCRPPGCPNPLCRARPSALEVLVTGRIGTVRCTVCSFSWRSATSVQAVQVYFKEKRQLERKRLRLRARAIKAQVPLRDPRLFVLPIRPVVVDRVFSTDAPAALVAAVQPNQVSGVGGNPSA